MKKKILTLILMVIGCLMITGCGCSKKEYTVNFDSNGGSKVESVTVKGGKKVSKPENPTKDGYTFDNWYLSLDDSKAYDFDQKVEKDFTLYAKWISNEGKCNLTCGDDYTLNEETCSCEDSIKISVNKTSLTLAVGDSEKIKVTVNPSDTKLTWKSSDTKVATVDENGTIKAIKTGSANITVTAGSKKITIKVTVKTKSAVETEKYFASVVDPEIKDYISDFNGALDSDTGIKDVTFKDDTVTFDIDEKDALVLDVATKSNIAGFFEDFLGKEVSAKQATYSLGGTKRTVDLTKDVDTNSLAKEILLYLAGSDYDKSAVELTLGDIANTTFDIDLTFTENGKNYTKTYTIDFNSLR